MLFRYENKVFIKPFADKLVKVDVTKKGNEYDVKATKEIVVITPEINEKLYSISLEEGYKMSNKTSFSKE